MAAISETKEVSLKKRPSRIESVREKYATLPEIQRYWYRLLLHAGLEAAVVGFFLSGIDAVARHDLNASVANLSISAALGFTSFAKLKQDGNPWNPYIDAWKRNKHKRYKNSNRQFAWGSADSPEG